MNHKQNLDSILKKQVAGSDLTRRQEVEAYARGVSLIENALVVVSDIRHNSSRIFAGKFAANFELSTDCADSIWENEILALMPESDREQKFFFELQFFQFLRRVAPGRRKNYMLSTHLRMLARNDQYLHVRHRTFYIYGDDNESVEYAVCIYESASSDSTGSNEIIDTATGLREALQCTDKKILSTRELQILSLVRQGFTSKDIAGRLNISKNTVSRHRQEIIAKLQVHNTVEAIKVGETIGLFV